MGQDILVSCRECDYRGMFRLGVGMNDWCLENVSGQIRGRARAEVEEILLHSPITGTDYDHMLFRCPRCEALYSRFYVRILHGRDSVYETTFRCRRCRRPLERVDLGEGSAEYPRLPPDLPCPGCGQPALEAQTMLMWD